MGKKVFANEKKLDFSQKANFVKQRRGMSPHQNVEATLITGVPEDTAPTTDTTAGADSGLQGDETAETAPETPIETEDVTDVIIEN